MTMRGEAKRSSAVGLKRIQLGVDFDEDKRLRLLQAECGLVGLAVIIKLLCKIYGGGYFTEWTEVERILFASDNRMELSELDHVIERAMRWGLFSADAYGLYEVLTSEEIQEHYLESTKRRQRLELVGDYLLVDPWRFRTVENTCLRYVRVSDGVDACKSGILQNGDSANNGIAFARKDAKLQNCESVCNENDFAHKDANVQNCESVDNGIDSARKSEKLQNGVSAEVSGCDSEADAEMQNGVSCAQKSETAEGFTDSVAKNELESEKCVQELVEKKKEEKKEKSPLMPPLSFPPVPPLSYPPYNPPQKKEKKKEKEPFVDSANFSAKFDEAKRGWNAMAGEVGLSEIVGLSNSRKEKMRLRFEEWAKELPERSPMETFGQILDKVRESDFLCGRTTSADGRSWKCNFDFIFANDNNWRKVLEGRYENDTPRETIVTDNSDNTAEDYLADMHLGIHAVLERAEEEERAARAKAMGGEQMSWADVWAD